MPSLLFLITTFVTFLTLALALPAATVADSAIINIEAIWGDVHSAPHNKTFAVPLDKPWKHAAFSGLNYLYLIGAKGDVEVDSIECNPYWTKKNGMSYAGLWLTSQTPSSPNDVFADLSDASLKLTCSAP